MITPSYWLHGTQWLVPSAEKCLCGAREKLDKVYEEFWLADRKKIFMMMIFLYWQGSWSWWELSYKPGISSTSMRGVAYGQLPVWDWTSLEKFEAPGTTGYWQSCYTSGIETTMIIWHWKEFTIKASVVKWWCGQSAYAGRIYNQMYYGFGANMILPSVEAYIDCINKFTSNFNRKQNR